MTNFLFPMVALLKRSLGRASRSGLGNIVAEFLIGNQNPLKGLQK
jgi:hypothetical protein